jgi:hypothetical protein
VVLGPPLTVDKHRAGVDQALGGGARAGGAARGKEGVQAQPGVLRASL